jgi:hypothetical protein
MIGSLVVILPSDTQGRALVVEHGGTSVTYRSSKTALSFVAIYVDCRHGPAGDVGPPGCPDPRPSS